MTIALWCVFVGVLLPYICFGIARNRGRDSGGKRLRDNSNPRDFPNRIEGVAKRAWDAHLNAFESFPGFGLAVVVAHLAHALQSRIDLLAVVWVVARVAHMAFYVGNAATLRSLAQVLSLACVLGIFAVAGLG